MKKSVEAILKDLDFVRVTNLEGIETQHYPDALGVWYSKKDPSVGGKWVFAIWTQEGELWMTLRGGRAWYGEFIQAVPIIAPAGRYAFDIPQMGRLLARQLEARSLNSSWEPALIM